jgi:hypothetical protein
MPFDITNHFLVSLAYKAAVIQGMLGEGNFAAERLHLAEPLPIEAKAVRATNVNPPLRGGLGSFETDLFFYSFPGKGDSLVLTNSQGTVVHFPERGKLAYIEKKDPFKDYGGSLEQSQESLAKIQSQIDTNGAYTLATQWLAAVSVDVKSLESRYRSQVTQMSYCSPPLTPDQAMEMTTKDKSLPPGHTMVNLPIFDVTWGGTADQNPPVWVQVFGVKKELIRLRMEDTTFLQRAPIVITNALELNSTSSLEHKTLRTDKDSRTKLNSLPDH